MKDHQIAEIVNALRDAAVTHHASGQLRERLRSCIEPLLLAIAPPVAAGSVDIDSGDPFLLLLQTYGENFGAPMDAPHRTALISYINAWGAQQMEAGLAEAEDAGIKIMRQHREYNAKIKAGLTERAEKAEFLLADALDTNARNVAFLTKAEARVKELEEEVDNIGHGSYLILPWAE